jgi:uncharacterized membrane protein YhfC
MKIAGIALPSSDPVFLVFVAFHVFVALICVISGAVAMLSTKQAGRHPAFGTIYYWSLAAVFASATVLSIMRWPEDNHLFVLGALAFAAASAGRMARRRQWANWLPQHITGMGSSYILMLVAFYVDNGKSLPLWKDLPVWTYWTLPPLIGVSIILWALVRHPLMQRVRGI